MTRPPSSPILQRVRQEGYVAGRDSASYVTQEELDEARSQGAAGVRVHSRLLWWLLGVLCAAVPAYLL